MGLPFAGAMLAHSEHDCELLAVVRYSININVRLETILLRISVVLSVFAVFEA